MKKINLKYSIIFLAFLLVGGTIFLYFNKSNSATEDTSKTKGTTEAVSEPKTVDNLYGKEYYEYLLVYRNGSNLRGVIYNNVSTEPIPNTVWQSYDDAKIAKDNKAFRAIKNGPRFLTVDSVTDYGNSTLELGDYEMTLAGAIEASIADTVNKKPYETHTAEKNTDWGFKKGSPVYKLITDTNETYLMQAASKEVNEEMSFSELNKLGEKLELPEGWRYETEILTDDYILETKGEIEIIQDEFKNTYQKVPD